MERADIKLAIDMLAGMDEEARIAAHCIGTLEDCGNEIAQLRAELAAAQQRIVELEKDARIHTTTQRREILK